MFEIKQQQQQQQKQGPAVGIRSYDVAALFPSQPSTNAVAGTSSTLAVAGTSGGPTNKRKKPSAPAPGPVQGPSPPTVATVPTVHTVAVSAPRKKGGKGVKKAKKNDPLTQDSQFPFGVEGEITISEEESDV